MNFILNCGIAVCMQIIIQHSSMSHILCVEDALNIRNKDKFFYSNLYDA